MHELQKYCIFCPFSTRKPWFLSGKLFHHAKKGTSSLKRANKLVQKRSKKRVFGRAKRSQTRKNIGFERFFWNWTPKMQVSGAPNPRILGFWAQRRRISKLWLWQIVENARAAKNQNSLFSTRQGRFLGQNHEGEIPGLPVS